MIDFVYCRGFKVRVYWERRAETPDTLTARFVQTIKRLQKVDPVVALWTCGSKVPRKFETMRNRYADEVAEGISKDDWGEPEPIWGIDSAPTRGNYRAITLSPCWFMRDRPIRCLYE